MEAMCTRIDVANEMITCEHVVCEGTTYTIEVSSYPVTKNICTTYNRRIYIRKWCGSKVEEGAAASSFFSLYYPSRLTRSLQRHYFCKIHDRWGHLSLLEHDILGRVAAPIFADRVKPSFFFSIRKICVSVCLHSRTIIIVFLSK